MLLRAIALLMIGVITAYCWLRVLSRSFRSRNKVWWLKLAGVDDDLLDRRLSLVGALATTGLFIYTAGLGYWWK